MTSSPDTRQNVDRLPPGLSSMWRLCKLGYRHEPGLLLAAFSLALLSALPDSLIALWFLAGAPSVYSLARRSAREEPLAGN